MQAMLTAFALQIERLGSVQVFGADNHSPNEHQRPTDAD
jgi:hypothetical protein